MTLTSSLKKKNNQKKQCDFSNPARARRLVVTVNCSVQLHITCPLQFFLTDILWLFMQVHIQRMVMVLSDSRLFAYGVHISS